MSNNINGSSGPDWSGTIVIAGGGGGGGGSCGSGLMNGRWNETQWNVPNQQNNLQQNAGQLNAMQQQAFNAALPAHFQTTPATTPLLLLLED